MKVKIIILMLALWCSVQSKKLEEKFAWKHLNFAWPTEQAMHNSIKSGKYIIENNLPLGLDLWKNKLFVTVPRWKPGVASSLNYFIMSDEKSPVFYPYPSWEVNTLPEMPVNNSKNGNSRMKLKIYSSFRLRIDECDRLWVIDSGLTDISSRFTQLAPPAIVIFDLHTDKLIKRFEIPKEYVKEDSFFSNIIVDTQKARCEDAHAYVPDLGSYAVVVFSLKKNKSWRIRHNFFYFDPLQGNYRVGGINFQWSDGIFGMALGKIYNLNGDRLIYFHAFSSTKEFVVSNAVFKHESYSQSSESYYAYKLLGDRGMNSQSNVEFFDKRTNVIFYTQVNKDAIGCWNIKNKYTPENQGIVDQDSESLIFPNDLKVDSNGNLWVFSDRLSIFLFDKLKPDEYNFRILMGNTKELITGTPCDSNFV